MSLPFKRVRHRLQPGDVIPVELVNRLGERLLDARDFLAREHDVDRDDTGGRHRFGTGVPIASALYLSPAGSLDWRWAKWSETPPAWSYGAWAGEPSWGTGGLGSYSAPVSQSLGAFVLEAEVRNPDRRPLTARISLWVDGNPRDAMTHAYVMSATKVRFALSVAALRQACGFLVQVFA